MTDALPSRRLIPPAEVRALSARSDRPGLVRLAIHAVALSASGLAIWASVGTIWLLPAMFVHGVQLAFLFNLHHECIHLTCFRSHWINKAINWLLGLVVFYPPQYFKHFHFTHHRHTQDPDKDPELGSRPPSSRLQYWWWIVGVPYWKRRFTTSLRHAISGKVSQPFIPERCHAAIVREARIVWSIYLVLIGASIAFQSWAIVLYWLGPMALGQPMLRLYQLAEHGGTEHTDDTFRNSRTTVSNAIVRWIAWNMPYHTEHHLYPSVPFHALPKLHARVRDRLQILSPGYIEVNRTYYRNLPAQKAG